MANSTTYSLSTISQIWSGLWVNSYILVIILAGITIFAFLPTFSNDFQLAWDDTWQVLENPLVNSPLLQDIVYHLTHFWQQQFSPVNSLFYLVIFQLFGMSASTFHTACLLIHCGNVTLVFLITKKLLPTLLHEIDYTKVSSYAFFTALIFAIHPMQVESVAWISASKILLYGFFTLTALFCYIRYIQSGHYGWLSITVVAFLLGFGSKEQAIILPLNLVLFDYAFGRFCGLTWKSFLTSRVLLEKIPLFLLALGFWYFSWINNLGTINPEAYPLYQRAVFGFYSFTEYIFRFLAPVKLYFFHPFPIALGEQLPLYFYGYIALVGIVGYFVWDTYRKGNKLVLIGFLFFLINLLLVLHIIPLPRTVITADRYMYLSIVEIAILLVWQVDLWLTSFPTTGKTILFVMGFA
ncbi:MAG: hypothetical protein ABJ333_15535 [Algoriphagus sp.]|uniref:hypothetical protein n=1 Tax=Algoriphagus sp. TaxID=1872435 RepID=UPI003298A387